MTALQYDNKGRAIYDGIGGMEANARDDLNAFVDQHRRVAITKPVRVNCQDNGGMRLPDGCDIDFGHHFYFGGGWASGAVIHTDPSRWYNGQMTEDIKLSFSGPGKIIFMQKVSAKPRKGILLRNVRRFEVLRAKISADADFEEINLFLIELHGAEDGLIDGQGKGLLSNFSGHRGSDKIHLTHFGKNLNIRRMVFDGFDDCLGITDENGYFTPSHFENITVADCIGRSWGYGLAKLKQDKNAHPDTMMRKITFKNYTMDMALSPQGAGVPIFGDSQIGTIEDIAFEGGKIKVRVPLGFTGAPDWAIFLKRIKRFSLIGTEIDHFHRTILRAHDCPDLVFRPKWARPIRRDDGSRYAVPANQKMAAVHLFNCPDHDIDLSAIEPSWLKGERGAAADQELMIAA